MQTRADGMLDMGWVLFR